MTFYGTFGEFHSNAGCYVVLLAPNIQGANAQMYMRFGQSWLKVYTEEEWTVNGQSHAEIYSLKGIK